MKKIIISLCLLLATTVMASAQTTLKIQSSYPAGSTWHDHSAMWAKSVEALTNGSLKIDLKSAGQIVPAFEVLDAVNKGVLDGADTQSYYFVGKDKTLALFNSPAGGPYGMDGMDFLGWFYHGGGFELYQQFYKEKLDIDIVGFPFLPTQNQPLGWFYRPIKDLDDLKNFKCRQTGLNTELYKRMGMQTVSMPLGEVVAAGQKGVINCAEYQGPVEDLKMGMQTVWKYYYLHSHHENSNTGDLMIRGDVWRKLTPQQQQAIKSAAHESYVLWLVDIQAKSGSALKEMVEKYDVKVMKTPNDILKAELKTVDEIFAEESKNNPWFKKVLESQKAWASKVVPYKRVGFIPYTDAADYYWGNK